MKRRASTFFDEGGLAMHPLILLFDVVSPKRRADGGLTTTERMLVAVVALLASLALAALWGIAAGTQGGHWAFGNAVTVPVLIVVSSLAALPLGLVAWKLTTPDGRALDLVVGHAAGAFAATLVLALLAPLIALYQHSSAWAGPVVAMGSVAVALVVGLAIFVRVIGKLVPDSTARRAFIAPAALVLVAQLAALAQLCALTSPILPRRTAFGRGIDGVGGASSELAP
jgi:hypothetical protein